MAQGKRLTGRNALFEEGEGDGSANYRVRWMVRMSDS